MWWHQVRQPELKGPLRLQPDIRVAIHAATVARRKLSPASEISYQVSGTKPVLQHTGTSDGHLSCQSTRITLVKKMVSGFTVPVGFKIDEVVCVIFGVS